MISWIGEHEIALYWLTGLSGFTFVATLLVVPLLVIRLPVDYFSHRSRHVMRWEGGHPLVRVLLLVVKNVLGGVLLVIGATMLVLPGQGLLTMVMGFMLLDFPGKFRFERRLVRWRPVIRTINWLRHRAGRRPMIPPGP